MLAGVRRVPPRRAQLAFVAARAQCALNPAPRPRRDGAGRRLSGWIGGGVGSMIAANDAVGAIESAVDDDNFGSTYAATQEGYVDADMAGGRGGGGRPRRERTAFVSVSTHASGRGLPSPPASARLELPRQLRGSRLCTPGQSQPATRRPARRAVYPETREWLVSNIQPTYGYGGWQGGADGAMAAHGTARWRGARGPSLGSPVCRLRACARAPCGRGQAGAARAKAGLPL